MRLFVSLITMGLLSAGAGAAAQSDDVKQDVQQNLQQGLQQQGLQQQGEAQQLQAPAAPATLEAPAQFSAESAAETDIGSAAAESRKIAYTCVLQDLQRRVEIDYLDTDAGVPCEVNYYKDVETPGTRQTLWSASSTEGYCEQQAEGLVAKLQSWGWECGGQ